MKRAHTGLTDRRGFRSGFSKRVTPARVMSQTLP